MVDDHRPQASRRRRWVVGGLLLAILVLALVPRWLRTEKGLPYVTHFDEPAIAHRALRMVKTGDFNPHFFNYGSLMIYLNAGVDALHYLYKVSRPQEGPGEPLRHPNQLGPEVNDWYWSVAYPSFYLWNRRLTVLFALLAIFLTFELGRRIGDARVGLAAAALLGVLPIHVEHSAYVTTDVPASTFGLIVALASLLFLVSERRQWWWLALAAGGLAASTKYNSAICLILPLAAFVLTLRGLRGAALWEKARHGWPLFVVPPAFFLLGSPYALLDLPAFLRDLGYELYHYNVLGHPGNETEPGLAHLARMLEDLVEHASPAAVAAMVVGLGVLWVRGRHRWLFLLPAIHLLAMMRMKVYFVRNQMILYPFAALLFGLGVVAAVDLLRRWGLRRGQRRETAVRWAVCAALALILGAAWLQVTRRAQVAAARVDTRTQMIELLARESSGGEPEARSGTRDRRRDVVIARELHVHPADLARLEPPARVLPLALAVCSPARRGLLVLPTRLTKGLEDRPAEGGRQQLLDAERGRRRELFALGGDQPTRLNVISPRPGLVALAPLETPSDALPLECAARLDLERLDCDDCRVVKKARLLMDGARLETPRLTIDGPIRLRAVVDYRARGAEDRSAPAVGEIFLTWIFQPAGGEEQVLAQRRLGVKSTLRSRQVEVEVPSAGEMVVRIRVRALQDGAGDGAAEEQLPFATRLERLLIRSLG